MSQSKFIAKGVMSRNLITIEEDSTIYKAMKILLNNNITGLPVVSEHMDLVGIVSEKDLMKELIDKSLKSIKKSTINMVMQKDVICFDENDSVLDVARSLAANSFRREPILSEGKLVGIITRRDIIKYMLQWEEVKQGS